jgi:glycine C-acetyltransferase
VNLRTLYATVTRDDQPADVGYVYEVIAASSGGALLTRGPLLDTDTPVVVVMHIEGEAPARLRGCVRAQERVGPHGAALRVAFGDSGLATMALNAVLNAVYGPSDRPVIGQVRAEMQRRGVTDIALVADEVHRVRTEQATMRLLGADLYTEHGSGTSGGVVSTTTGEVRECILWSLNLYLGLNRVPRVIEHARAALARLGTGAGTSAPSGGLSALHREVADRVARMTSKEKAVLFPTGYGANLGALSALPGPKDLILLDREAHASMFDGVKLSGRKWLAFQHNDVADLAAKLERYSPHHENVFVVVESAYSMSGDLCPLREIAALKRKFPFYLYVDEAHTFGFYGERGRGYCHEQGVADQVDFIMSTFSKATASLGGFVAAQARFCSLLEASATPFIFQACMSPADAATIIAALDEIEHEPGHARALHENNDYMRRRLVREGFDLGASRSPVVPVYVPDIDKLYRLCVLLQREGIFSVPVVYPAVGPNEGRIRFIVNAHHTRAQIDRTVETLGALSRTLGVLPERRRSIMPEAMDRVSVRPSSPPKQRESVAPPSM